MGALIFFQQYIPKVDYLWKSRVGGRLLTGSWNNNNVIHREPNSWTISALKDNDTATVSVIYKRVEGEVIGVGYSGAAPG